MDNGLSVADAMALTRNNDCSDGWFGGSGAWVFFLFFLLAWGNGGWGGFGNNAANGALTRAELNEGLNNQTVIGKLDGISNGICDGFYAQNTTMLQGLYPLNFSRMVLPLLTPFLHPLLPPALILFRFHLQSLFGLTLHAALSITQPI